MLNPPNTQCFLIGSRQLQVHIPSNCDRNRWDTITPSNFMKSLGVYVGRFMLLDKHTDVMGKKAIGI